MSGKSIQSLLHNVSAVLKLPVLLFNQHLKPIASSKADAAGTLSDYEGIFQKETERGSPVFQRFPTNKPIRYFRSILMKKNAASSLSAG